MYTVMRRLRFPYTVALQYKRGHVIDLVHLDEGVLPEGHYGGSIRGGHEGSMRHAVR